MALFLGLPLEIYSETSNLLSGLEIQEQEETRNLSLRERSGDQHDFIQQHFVDRLPTHTCNNEILDPATA